MSPGFVHLHLHTEYSLVDSTVRIQSLMAACRDDGMPAVAMTDQNNLFALVKFYRAAEAAGIKPIIGADVLLRAPDDGAVADRVRAGANALCSRFTPYPELAAVS